MKTLLTISFISFLAFFSFADSGKTFLKKVRENYENIESLEVYMNYALYKGFSSDSIVNEYNSVYYREGENSYRKINDTEIIIFDDIEVKINHDQKAVQISNSVDLSTFDFDLKGTLKKCEKILISKKNKNTLVTLILKEKISLPYSKLELEINKKYWIEEITMFYTSRVNFSTSYFEQDYDFPKLVVTYNGFKKKWKDKEGLLKLENYVQMKSNSPAVGIGQQLNYEILDVRFTK